MVERKPIFFLGDSHTCYFAFAGREGLFAPFEVQACIAHGATAAGLTNPNSFTAAAEKFRSFLRKRTKEATLVFHLGEVDCGILIWMRIQKNASSVTKELQRSVDAYFSFIDELLNDGYYQIIVTSATLPTISDSDQLGAIVNERRSKIRATQLERTNLTLEFNRMLEEAALLRNLHFVDVSQEMLDDTTSVVDTRYRNKNPADHHMDNRMAAAVWAPAVFKAVAQFHRTDLPFKTWKAKTDTSIKAYAAPAVRLAADHRLAIKAGQLLSAFIANQQHSHLLLTDISVDGKPLPSELRYIFTKHWFEYSPEEQAPMPNSPQR